MFEKVEDLRDLDLHLFNDIEGFFECYDKLHGKAFRVKAQVDVKAAPKLVKRAWLRKRTTEEQAACGGTAKFSVGR